MYANAPQSARNALNAVKKVEARTEVGIRYENYSTVVGEAWADVKIFIESPEGKNLQEFDTLLAKAIANYKLAADIWQNKIQWPTLYADRTDVEALQQECWIQAEGWITLAESLLDAKRTAKTLESMDEISGKAADLNAKWKDIEKKILK